MSCWAILLTQACWTSMHVCSSEICSSFTWKDIIQKDDIHRLIQKDDFIHLAKLLRLRTPVPQPIRIGTLTPIVHVAIKIHVNLYTDWFTFIIKVRVITALVQWCIRVLKIVAVIHSAFSKLYYILATNAYIIIPGDAKLEWWVRASLVMQCLSEI